MAKFPSIFNDVIGPVMRGPSSSHCAASLRIGRICRDLMGGDIGHILIEFDPDGSLATTHKSQGSDMGLFGGFLGWEADDERLPESEAFLDSEGVSVEISIDIRRSARIRLWQPRSILGVLAWQWNAKKQISLLSTQSRSNSRNRPKWDFSLVCRCRGWFAGRAHSRSL